MKQTQENDQEDLGILANDIPFGESVGIILGKTVSGIGNGIRNPILGVSNLAGTCEGFFRGFKLGMEVQSAHFRIAKARGMVNKAERALTGTKKHMEHVRRTLDELPPKQRAELFERMRDIEPATA